MTDKKKSISTSKINFFYNPYHIVNASPWPFLTALALMQLVFSVVHLFETSSYYLLVLSIIQISFFVYSWFRDITVEATFEGQHTKTVQKSLKLGMIFFIVSEIMFFFGFFWSYFHVSLLPSIWIGCVWPPVGIQVIDPFLLPLCNTIILLSSGISLTLAHKILITGGIKRNRYMFIFSMVYTILLGVLFLVFQVLEYNYSTFAIDDSVYGSTFYMLTGFHGLHVFVGLVFLIVCFWRFLLGHLSQEHHVGFECAVWYWHFVDVVWLFLYIFVYVLGSGFDFSESDILKGLDYKSLIASDLKRV